MHILNRLFNKVYMITVCLPNERISYIQDYYKSISLNFDTRVSPHINFLKEFTHDNTHVNENEQSLTSNYASIIYESYYNQLETFVILEDDNIFNINFEEEFKLFYENIPNDWDVIHLSDYDNESHIKKISINDHCDRIFIKYTTNCMIFKNLHKYKIIADTCINSRYPTDYVINSLCVENKLICYSPKKKITNQLSYRVDSDRNLLNKKFNSLIRFTK